MSEIQLIIDQYLEDKRRDRPNYGVSIMKFNGGWDFMRGIYDWNAAVSTARQHSQDDQLCAVTHKGVIVALWRDGQQVYLAPDYQKVRLEGR